MAAHPHVKSWYKSLWSIAAANPSFNATALFGCLSLSLLRCDSTSTKGPGADTKVEGTRGRSIVRSGTVFYAPVCYVTDQSSGGHSVITFVEHSTAAQWARFQFELQSTAYIPGSFASAASMCIALPVPPTLHGAACHAGYHTSGRICNIAVSVPHPAYLPLNARHLAKLEGIHLAI